MNRIYQWRSTWGVPNSQAVWMGVVLFLTIMSGCTPPPGTSQEKPPADVQKEKAPATTAYGKAMEATERLKDQAKEYNDRLEKLNDPFAK
ncbi:MAG: hypothetical protein JNL67_11890 [Planctomycetaceae bacterium]|nr:hypothetical protein [Planctomycetaceae bacterium]